MTFSKRHAPLAMLFSTPVHFRHRPGCGSIFSSGFFLPVLIFSAFGIGKRVLDGRLAAAARSKQKRFFYIERHSICYIMPRFGGFI
jgi:hypothetical protein